MRGRKPAPAPIHEDADDALPVALPPCPPVLTDEARDEWDRITALLLEQRTITALDLAVLATYCQAWATWQHAQEKLAETDAVIRAPSGFPVLNPWLSVASQAFKQMQASIAELGLSPVARARFAAGQRPKKAKPKATGWEGLLAGGAAHAN